MTGGRSLRRLTQPEGRSLIGVFSIIPSTDVVEMIAIAGFDFVVLDMEHGPYALDSVRSCVLAAHARGMSAVVRVRSPEPSLLGSVLDIGADGVLAPHVSSAAMARQVVEAARFAPEGSRGANPYVRAAEYGEGSDWFAKANRDVVVMVMIEGVDGLSALSGILEVPGLDVVFLGPVDISHSMGVPGQPNHPMVLDVMEEAARQAAARGLCTAVFAPDVERARSWRSRGIRMIVCGVDTNHIRSGLSTVMRGVSAP